ncbi:protein FANTASTIC FOUR 1 [Carica papaya]|uniref:protein FANTASTIC FOUR 1 n=1 Tax=Carica papaya TaxID=3649 RepID=UPI000B8C7D2C|nr:protein FANTASTIC FOUR 1 [Carica papaya]
MMSFCKKSVHSFLGLTAATAKPADYDYGGEPPCKCGLGIITAPSSSDAYRGPNIIESSLIKIPMPAEKRLESTEPPTAPFPAVESLLSRKDLGDFGFIDEVGGGVDGLMSCTESLGFESYDERRVDEDCRIDIMAAGAASSSSSLSSSRRKQWREDRQRSKREPKKFPPPLSSLNDNGQPNFFLRPVRKDGRLELTEVRIHRPEILRASRQDGRLRLHLITDEEQGQEDVDVSEEEEIYEEAEQELMGFERQEEEEEDEDEEELVEEEEEEEEWRLGSAAVSSGSGDGMRIRCHDVAVVNHHHDHHHHHYQHDGHHHNLHVWSQHCVTTR